MKLSVKSPLQNMLIPLVVFLSLIPTAVFSAEPPALREAGSVTALSGQATVARKIDPQSLPLHFKDSVYLGDQINTAPRSLARVLLGGKALVTIRERSVFYISEEKNRSIVDMTLGKLSLAVARQLMAPGETIEVRTPNAIAAVRGTVLIVEVEPPTSVVGNADPASTVTTFTVLKGFISLSNLSDPQTRVTLNAYEAVNVTGQRVGTIQPVSPAAAAQLVNGFQLPLPIPEKPNETRQSFAAGEMAKATALAKYLAPDAVQSESSGNDATLADASTPLLLQDSGSTSASMTLTSSLASDTSHLQPPVVSTTEIAAELQQVTGVTPPPSEPFPTTLSAGTLTVNSPTNVSTFTQTGGTLTGPASLTIAGLLAWSNGTQSGTGSTIASGGLDLGTSGTQTLDQRTLVLSGTTTNSGSFTAVGEADLLGTRTFSNSGTFAKTGAGTTTVAPTLNNTGTLSVQNGQLALTGSGSSTGDIFVALGSTMEFAAGSYLLTGNVSGPGTVLVSGAIVDVAGGTYNITGNSTTVTGGTLTFDNAATVASLGPLTVSGGTLTLNSGEVITVPSLTLQGAETIAGTDAVTVTDLTTKSFSGTATVILPLSTTGGISVTGGELLLNASGTHMGAMSVAPGATLNFGGGAHDLNAGTSLSGAGAVLVNSAVNINTSGVDQLIGTISVTDGALTVNGDLMALTSSLNPTGTVVKVGSGGNLTIAGANNNLVDLGAGGALTLPNGGAILDATRSGTTTFSSSLVNMTGGTLTAGIGTANALFGLTGRTATITSGALVNIGGGTFDMPTGHLVSLTNTSTTSTLNLTSGPLIAVSGTGIFRLTNGSFFNFTGAGNTVNFTAAPSCEGPCPILVGGFGIQLTGGALATQVQIDPTFAAVTGTGTITGVGANNALIVVNGTGSQVFFGQTFGPGSLVIPPDQTINTNRTFADATQTSGILSGTGTVTVLGPYAWSGGVMTGGAITFVNGGTISGTVTLDNTRVLHNTGTLTWTGPGTVNINNSGLLFNQAGATFTIQGDGTIATTENSGTFTNNGSITKSITTGTTTIGTVFNNGDGGAVSVQSGSLAFTGGGFNSGTISPLGTNTTIQFSGGTYQFQAGTLLTGAGCICISDGAAVTVNVNGVDRLTGTLSVTGGTLTVNGDLVSLTTGQSLNPTTTPFNFTGGNVTTTGAMINLDSATLTQTGASLVKIAGGNVSVGGGIRAVNSSLSVNQTVPLFDLRAGASLTSTGPALELTNTSLNLGNQPFESMTGGSLITSTGPVFKVTGGSFTAGTLTAMDGTGNRITRTGTLLDLTNTTVTLRSITDFGSTDSIAITLGAGQANVQMTDSNVTLTGAQQDLSVLGGLNTVEPVTHAGVALIATDTVGPPDHAITVTGALARFVNGVTLTDPGAQIQLTNMTVNTTGTSSIVEVGVGFPTAVRLAGGLFQATNSVLNPASGTSLLRLLPGSSLTVGGSVLDLTNSNLDLTLGRTAQPLMKLTGGSSFVNTLGPLIRMNGGTLNADALLITDSTFNSFSTAGTVLDLTNATVTMRTIGEEQATQSFFDTTAISLSVNEPFYRLNDSTITLTQLNQDGLDLAPNGEALGVQGGVTLIATNDSTFSTAGALLSLEHITYTDLNPQIQLTDSTLVTTGTRSLVDVLHSTPTVTGPLLTATNSTLTLSSGLLSVEPFAQLTTSTTLPLFALTGGTHTIASVSGSAAFDLNGSFLGETQTIDGVALRLGTDLPIVGGTVASPVALAAPLLETSGATVSMGTAVRVDTALLEATAPLIRALNGSTVTVTGAAFQVGANSTLRNSGVASSSMLYLDKSAFIVNGGPLFNLTGAGGSFLQTVAGDLLFLTNGSVLDVTSATNGFLIQAAGNSVVNINGGLVRFGTPSGNSIFVRNTVAPNATITVGEFNFPVSLVNGATASQVTIQGTPIKNLASNSITIGTPTEPGSLFQLSGTTTHLNIKGN